MDVLTFLCGVISGALLVALVSAGITLVGRHNLANTEKRAEPAPLLGVISPPERSTF